MDEESTSRDFSHDSDKPPPLEMQSDVLPDDILKKSYDNDHELEPPLLVSSVGSVVELPNGFHKSAICLEREHNEQGGNKQNKADGCWSASGLFESPVSVGCEVEFQAKSRWKTNEEHQPPISSFLSNNFESNDDSVVRLDKSKNVIGCHSVMKDFEDKESNKQLKELMEFLQAPTEQVKANYLSGKNIFKSQRLDVQDANGASDRESVASCIDSCSSGRNNHCMVAAVPHISSSISSVLVFEHDVHGPGITSEFHTDSKIKKSSVGKESSALSGTDSSCSADECLELDAKNDVKSSSEPPQIMEGSHSTDGSIQTKNKENLAFSLVDFRLSPTLTSAISLLPSHRPIKKRIGLENILSRRLLQAAKPVSHSSIAAAEKEINSGDNKGLQSPGNPSSLHLSKSVQILTDHPKSIAVVENESKSGKTIKEILELNSRSVIGDELVNEDPESNFKRMHKRKCSSPQRIVKKSLIKVEDGLDVETNQSNSMSSETSPTSQISKPNPCIISSMQPVVNSSSSCPTQIPQSKTTPPSNPVPFLSGLPMNVITIAPDENYVEPSQSLKAKPSVVKSLRQLAPKTTTSSVGSQKALASGALASRHVTTPTNIIPISLVQSTTTPSLVILVNKTDTAHFISAQPFQLHSQQKQLQQISVNEQIKPLLISTPNLIQNSSQILSPQTHKQLKNQPHVGSKASVTTTAAATLLSSLLAPVNNSAASKPMPKLRLWEESLRSPPCKSKLSPSNNNLPSPSDVLDSSLNNFFEPFRNNCIIGKFVAPQLEPSNLLSGNVGAAGNSRFTCGSCGCKFPSETSLKEHVERKSFLVTFECSCHSDGVAQNCSTFYNLCSFSIYYRNHVLQHPYVPHSPANNYKVSLLPEDQFPEESLKLLKEKNSLMAFSETIQFGSTLSDQSSVDSSKSTKEKPVIQCKECNKEFKLPLRIKQHFQNSCNRPTTKSGGLDKTTGNSSASNIYKCSQCLIVLPNACSFKAHSRLHDSREPFVCPECGLTFSTFKVMKEHAYKICYHACRKGDIRGCRFCSFIPSDSSSLSECLNAHISKVHMPSLLKCPQCPEVNHDSTSIHKHSQIKHGTILHDCDIEVVSRCPVCEIFVNPTSEEVHLSCHSVEKKSKMYFFSCTECNKNFVYRGELEKHLRSSGHLGTKVNGYVCKLCTLTYPSREERCNHIITEHPNLKNMFVCELNTELSTLPLIGRREIVSPSDLNSFCSNETASSLQLINPNNVNSSAIVSSQNTTMKDALSSSHSDHDYYGCSLNSTKELSNANAGVNVSVNSLNETTSTSPERWECSRCNEVFINKAAFHRHQQKHRFLEQSKSKKRKLFTNVEDLPAGASIGNISAPEIITASARNNDETSAVANSVNSATMAVGGDVSLSTSTLDSLDSPIEAMKEEMENECESASDVLVEPNALTAVDASKSKYKILPQLLQKSQMQDSPGSAQNSPHPQNEHQDHPENYQCTPNENRRWHSCQFCSLSFSSSERLQYHVISRHIGLHSVKPDTYTCTYCLESNKRAFVSIRHLRKHLRVRHKIILNKAGQYASIDASCKLDPTLQHAFLGSESKEGDASSDGKCASEPFGTSPASELCGDVTQDDTTTAMDVDDERDHENIRSRKIHDSEGTFACSYCEYSSSGQYFFWEHIVIHEKEFFKNEVISNHKNFQCPECGSMFVVKVALLRHFKLVHKILEVQDYETKLREFEIFKEQHKHAPDHSRDDQNIEVHSLRGFHDLPANKLAKLASLRPEDIHSDISGSRKASFYEIETSCDHSMSYKRQGLRSQIKPGLDDTLPADNSSQAQVSSDEYQEALSQNECQVCYKTFDNHVELKIHMRVHGMAFIQGTRRSLTGNPTSTVVSSSTSASTNQKAIAV